MDLTLLQKIAIWTLPVIFAITLHETAHGWVASLFGDHTARLQGRLTLNPIKHIDILGTLIVPALTLVFGGIIFGWAKPVPVNYAQLKKPRLHSALVAFAGPCANFLMAIFFALLLRLGFSFQEKNDLLQWLIYTAQAGIGINIFLMLLNLLPLPPLDGSVIIASFLKGKLAYSYERLQGIGLLLLLLFVLSGMLNSALLPAFYWMNELVLSLVGLR